MSACHAGLLGDNPTPVGSGRLFMHFSSNDRTPVLPSSDLPPTTLFWNGLLIPTLRTQAEKMALTAYFSLFILAQMPSIASESCERRERSTRRSERPETMPIQ